MKSESLATFLRVDAPAAEKQSASKRSLSISDRWPAAPTCHIYRELAWPNFQSVLLF